jgi:hypothetical protein
MAKAVEVDFTGVTSGGKSLRVAPGDYVFKVKSAKVGKSKAGNPQFVWVLTGLNGAVKNQTLYYQTLIEKNQFNLRNLLLAMKVDVPNGKKAFKVDEKQNLLGPYVGKIFGATLADGEPYEGKVKSEITAVFPISIVDGKIKKEALPTGDELEEDATPDDVDSEEEGDDGEVEVEDDDSM